MFDKSLTYLFFKCQRVSCIYYILNFGGVHSFHRFDSYLFSASSFQTDLFESTLCLCHSIILIYHIGSPNGLFYKTCFQNLLCVNNFGSTMISMIASFGFFFPNWPSVSTGQEQVPDEVQERLQHSIYELLIRFYVQYSSWLYPFLGLICCHII